MSNFKDGHGYDPKNLQVIFSALLFAQLIFFVISMFVLDEAEFGYNFQDISFTVIPLAALVLDVVGNKLFSNGFAKLSSERDLSDALEKLNRIHIIRWALVEGATFLLIVFALMSENHFFSAFAATNIVYFFTLRPKIFTFNEGLNS